MVMKFVFGLLLTLLFVGTAEAAWYWPFGSDEVSEAPKRLSDLMEPASDLIDEASDLAAEGKISEAVEKYRAAIDALDKIEAENPERASQPEFATVRNKRAYVNAAIDELLLRQVRQNAKSVAVSDTTGLEQRLLEEKIKKEDQLEAESLALQKKFKEEDEREARQRASKEKPPAKQADEKSHGVAKAPDAPAPVKAPQRPVPSKEEVRPAAGKDRVVYDIVHGDYAAAAAEIERMLIRKPNDPLAMNLKSALYVTQGKLKEAEDVLDQCIISNPKDASSFYNMALLTLKKDPTAVSSARRYYQTSRTYGGPADPELEEILK